MFYKYFIKLKTILLFHHKSLEEYWSKEERKPVGLKPSKQARSGEAIPLKSK